VQGLDKIKQWAAAKARQSEDTGEAKEAIKDGATVLLPFFRECLGGDTKFLAFTMATGSFWIDSHSVFGAPVPPPLPKGSQVPKEICYSRIEPIKNMSYIFVSEG
jgi:hypothetical protein